ncbi:hypothetical protein [Nonomuraea sp. NPDC050783]|uniref:hypothetical protein n=1 Tax=Nonomuraea sp. NPDC050783 TaxID=3154634 RepID=UPI003466AC5D
MCTDQNRVLVDLGLGAVGFEVPGLGSFAGGKLLDGLRAEGLTPGDADRDVPVKGLTFANARHIVDRAEGDCWNGTAEIIGPDPAAVRDPVSAVIEFLEPGEPVVPGLPAVPTPGHTPDHTSLLVTDEASDDRLLVLGDVMPAQAQVSETHGNFLFDVNADEGTKTRLTVSQDHQDEHTVVAGGHFAGSVFGRFLPARYQYGWAISKTR